jgi:hypothetical protein
LKEHLSDTGVMCLTEWTVFELSIFYGISRHGCYSYMVHRYHKMNFSDKRFVDIGQTLYIKWLETTSNAASVSEEERREIFKFCAQVAFEAAEEFAKVFENQEKE